MDTILFYTIIAFLCVDFSIGRFLAWMNAINMDSPIPDVLSGIYDDDEYEKQQNYQSTTDKFSLWSALFSFLVTLLFLILGGFSFLHELLLNQLGDTIFLPLAFFGVLLLASDIISIPFEWYSTFVIEERFGFNKRTVPMFWLDKLKGWLLSVVLGGVILSAIVWFYNFSPTYFWLYAWVLLMTFTLLMTLFYSQFIVPLYNKQELLPDGELRRAIEAFAEKVNFPVDKMFVMDGSKRSTKANAYFTGFGKKKRIVLYDTLINDLSTEEIVGVLAHEVGHYKKKHTLQGMIIGFLQTGVMLYLVSLFVSSPSLSEALGGERAFFHLGLVAFGMLFQPISMILGVLSNLLSRHNEYQADEYACANYGTGNLISALKKLSMNHLSNLTPHRWYVFFYFSHPSLLQRVNAMLNRDK